MYLHQKQRFLIAFGRVVIVQDGALTSSFLLIQHHTSTTIPLHTETLINREPYRSRSLDEGFVIRPLRVVRSTCGVEEGSSSWREALRAVLVASGRRRSGLYPWPRPPSSTGSEHPWDRGESYSAALTRQVHAGLVQLPKLHHPVAVLDGGSPPAALRRGRRPRRRRRRGGRRGGCSFPSPSTSSWPASPRWRSYGTGRAAVGYPARPPRGPASATGPDL